MNKKFLISMQIKSILLNFIGFILQFFVIFIIGLTLSSYFASNKYLLQIALVWAFGLIAIGIIYKYRDWHDEYKTIESPWEMKDFGSKIMAQEVLVAFIVNEIVMGAAGCILKIIAKMKKIHDIKNVNDQDIKLIGVDLLRKVDDGQRFVKLSDVKLDKRAIASLISCGVIWTKIVNGDYMIGLNRDFESIIKNG